MKKNSEGFSIPILSSLRYSKFLVRNSKFDIQRSSISYSLRFFQRFGAKVFSIASVASLAGEDSFDHFQDRVDEVHFVGSDSGLEVSSSGAFGAESGTGEIGRSEVHPSSVDDDGLGVDPSAASHLEVFGNPTLQVFQQWAGRRRGV